MAYLSPREMALVALCRPELPVRALDAMQRFENKTGRQTYISEGFRSAARQTVLYNDSLRADGTQKYRVAKPGSSRHELGAAVDIHIVGVEDQNSTLYVTLGQCIEAAGLRWGGRFSNQGELPDRYHAELNETYAEALAQWEKLRGRHLQTAWILALTLAAGILFLRVRK